ncbi:MAG: YwmB family TATA-box binding protein [Dethiobacter sp.]|jgi:hypothetical protein|nr:YwmB family TATA-box binding protein [Dethiobacter sp.]
MSRKNKNFFLVVIVLILVFALRQPGRALEAPEALEGLLKSTGASVSEGEIQYLVSLGNNFWSMEELKVKLLAAADILGLKDGDVVSSEGATYRVLDVTGEMTLGPLAHIVVQSNPGDKQLGISPQSYLLVICRDSSIHNIKTLASRLETVMRPLAPGGQTSYYLTGSLPGKYSGDEMSKLAEKALETVNGKVVEGMWEEEIVSLTAYTPLISRHLGAGEDRFNLNIAVRYDRHSERTVIWAGFPLIHGSY